MKYVYLFFIICTINSFAQTSNLHKGRVIATELQAFPIKVINLTTKEEAVTDKAGYFNLTMNVNDVITLAPNSFYEITYIVKTTDLNQKLLRLYPETIGTVLKTIEINNVTTKSLGIDSKQIAATLPQKHYNMDFKALFVWLIGKIIKDKDENENAIELRGLNEQNPYVASLPKNIMTDYLKIPENLIEKFYYFMNDDYIVDEYIKNNEEEKWRLYLLDKSFTFLKNEGVQ